MSHWLSKEDPVYYKRALKELIAEAEENGLEVVIGFTHIINRLVFQKFVEDKGIKLD